MQASVLLGDLVWIQCKGYRCMAYQNAAGKWINFYTGQELKGSVQVIKEEEASLRKHQQ